MSIDKESNGLPQVNVHRRTTKVNLAIVVGVLVFFVLMIAVAFWASRREPAVTSDPAPASRSE